MILTALVFLAAGVAAPAATPATGDPPASTPSACCFTNPGYAGMCSVVPEEHETCVGILAYLNRPSSAGKTYCNNTRIRGGWKEVPCPPTTPPPATSASGESQTR